MPSFQEQRAHEALQPCLDVTKLAEVLARKKPTKYCWGDMTDMFGPWVPATWIDQCMAVMAATPHHTHQVLTKRPERMYRYFGARQQDVPLPSVWLGVHVENQATADTRIPWLLKTPAVIRFVSYEPALGPIALTHIHWQGQHRVDVLRRGAWDIPGWYPGFTNHADMAGVDWVICGGESGPHARPCAVAWLESVVKQCAEAHVACWVKQDAAVRSGQQGRLSEAVWQVKQFPPAPPHHLALV